MEQIVYGDILFIVNFSMDFLALYITSKLIHAKCHFAALIMSAGIGAIYGVAALFCSGAPLLNGVINTALALVMCFIVYGAPSLMLLIRNTLTFYGISFLMGGVMTGIFNLANRTLTGRGIVINGDLNTLYSGISPLSFVLIAVAAVVFSYICSAVMKRTADVKKAEVYIRIGKRDITLSGLCDSGNLLSEPIGSLPCLICTYESIKELLPVGLLPLFRDKNVGIMEYADPELVKKIRLIPMHVVGGTGIMVGIIPDEVKINGKAKELCVVCDPDTKEYRDTQSIIPTSVM